MAIVDVAFRQSFLNQNKYIYIMKKTMQNHISKVKSIMVTIGAARGRAARGRPKNYQIFKR